MNKNVGGKVLFCCKKQTNGLCLTSVVANFSLFVALFPRDGSLAASFSAGARSSGRVNIADSECQAVSTEGEARAVEKGAEVAQYEGK